MVILGILSASLREWKKFMWDPHFNAAILTLALYLKLNRLRSELYKRKRTGSLFMLGSLLWKTLMACVISPHHLNPVKCRKWFKQQWYEHAPLLQTEQDKRQERSVGSRFNLCTSHKSKVYFEQCLILGPCRGCKRGNWPRHGRH